MIFWANVALYIKAENGFMVPVSSDIIYSTV